MRNLRKSYGLPRRPPLPLRVAIVMFAIPLLALVGWLVLPDSPVVVALLVVVLLAAVFVGIALVLRSRELSDPPPRRPTPPR